MKDTHTLADWRHVRALADPLRMRILDAMKSGPRTTKQVAGLLGEPPTKLYHHVEVLEKAGLVRLQSTRPNRGTIERYYQSVAAEFVVDRQLLEGRALSRGRRGYEALFLSALEATLNEARKSVAAGLFNSVSKGRNALAYRFRFRGGEKEVKKKMAIVRRWIEECRHLGGGRDGPEYGIAIAFYPATKKRKHR
jgi:DNA-binding transcriptional ArsR family regulator